MMQRKMIIIINTMIPCQFDKKKSKTADHKIDDLCSISSILPLVLQTKILQNKVVSFINWFFKVLFTYAEKLGN